jgi:tetratricopeptide (TPR) repeat protein
MKLFDRLFNRTDIVLIGLHFGKSGGTSLLAHAVEHFADRSAVHGYGPFANAERLFSGERLLEEYSAEALRKVRFVFGHGVDADVPALFAPGQVRLFAVCRDPFDRFVSHYKHVRRTDSARSQIGARAFLDHYPANPFADAVMTGFGAYVGGDTGEAGLRATLRNFELVLTTEQLDAQSALLFGQVGLPPLALRKRVYPETPDLDGLTPEYIRARDVLDAMVDDSVNALFRANPGGTGGTLNPFGFDPSGREAYGDSIRRDPGREAMIERAYGRLFDQLREQDRLIAADRYLAIKDPNSVLPRLRRHCAAHGIPLDDDALGATGYGHLGEALLRAGRIEEARATLLRGLKRYPDSLLCLFVLAQSYRRTGDWQAVADYCERALDLNAMHTRALVLLGRAQAKLDRLTEARETLARACALEPSRHQAAKLLAEVEARLG